MGLLSFVGKLLGLGGTPAQKIEVSKSASAAGLPVIYGTRKVAPINVFKHVSRNNGPVGNDNYDAKWDPSPGSSKEEVRDNLDWLHRVGVWGQGEITGIDFFWVDGDSYRHNRFSGRPYFRALSYYGGPGQSACTDLTSVTSKWGTSHVGSGVAYSWLRFFNYKKPQFNSDPRVEAQVQGLKVWDPRLGEMAQSSAWIFSANRALVLLNYLMADYGAALTADQIDVPSFEAAADLCDEPLDIPALPTNTTGLTIEDYDPFTSSYQAVEPGEVLLRHRPYQPVTNARPRYECHAVLDPKAKRVVEILKDLLEGMGWAMPWSNGKLKLLIEAPVEVPVADFGADDILGGWVVNRDRRNGRLNRVTITFPNRNKDFEDDTVSWPKLGSDTHAALKDEDQGQTLQENETLDTVTDYYQALAYAEYKVRKSRIPMTIENLRLAPRAMLLEPGDVITLTDEAQGFDARWFIVDKVQITPDLEVTVSLSDYDAKVYGLEDPDDEPLREDGGGASPFGDLPAVENLTAIEEHDVQTSGGVISGVRVTWDAPVGVSTVLDYQLAWRLKPESGEPGPFASEMRLTGDATEAFIAGLVDDRTYTLQLVYHTRLGQESEAAEIDVDLAAQEGSIRQIISGLGAPGSSLGLVGWTYIDVETGDVYEKGGLGWGSPIGNIRGEDGDKWHSGAVDPNTLPDFGTNGDFFLNTDTNDVYQKVAVGVWSLAANIGAENYTWIAYADNASGTSNFTTGAPGNRTYVGIAVNRDAASESQNPSDYVWSRWSGPTTLEDVLNVTGWGAVPESGATRNTGDLADFDQVLTDYIAANAVTNPDEDINSSGSSSVSPQNISTTAVEIGSVTLNLTENTTTMVLARIDWDCNNSAVGDPYRFFIQRGNGTIVADNIGVIPADEGSFTLIAGENNAGTGQRTYTLKIKSNQSGNNLNEFGVRKHALIAWEQKR